MPAAPSPTPQPHRRTRALLGALIALLLALGTACTHTPATRLDDSPGARQHGVGGGEDLPELDEEVQAALDDAHRLAAAGHPAQARDAFLAIAAQHPNTPGAEFASVFAANADARLDPSPGALEPLADAAADSSLPTPTRAVAAACLALALARNAQLDQALDTLDSLYPGQAPPTVLPRADLPDLLILIAEARTRHGRHTDAIVALSWLFELGDPDQRRLARARALELARTGLNPDERLGLLDHPDDFVAAIAGAAWLLDQLLDPDDARGPDARARLADIGEKTSARLLRIDDATLADELDARLDALAGPAVLRVGALLPLSGADKHVGQHALDGLLLAQRAFRPSPNPRITLVVEDTRSTPEGARDGVDKLASAGVTAIVGPLSNAEARAAADAAERRHLPLVSLSLDPAVADVGPSIFRYFIDSTREVDALLAYTRTVGHTRLAVLYPDVPFGREARALVEKAAAAHGVEIVTATPYDPASRDFSAAAAAVARTHADAVFIPDVASRVSVLMPFLAAEQLWCAPADRPSTTEGRRHLTCLGNVTWYDDALLRDGASYFNGATIAASWTRDADGELNDRFLREHRAMIGGEPDVFAAFAFDAMRLLRRAILNLGFTTPTTLQTGIAATAGFDGLTGPVTVDPRGDIFAAPLLISVQDGRFVLTRTP